MPLERKLLRDRFDIVVNEIARLAGLGYALVPLSVKMSGIVMYATMEVNTDQLSDVGKTEKVDTEAKTETKTEASSPEIKVDTANPVTAKVSTKQPAKSTKTAKKDAE